MKTKIAILLSALCTLHSAFCAQTFPWLYYGQDSDGTPLTNTITIESWPGTNAITAVSTNLVTSFSKSYYPTNPAGFASNNLVIGHYRLTIYGQTRGAEFSIVSNNVPTILSQVAGVPVALFQNFTIAQFSDAGTAAYSNATSFFLAANAGTAAYSNTSAFLLSSRTNWAVAQITNSGTAAYSNATAFLLSSQTNWTVAQVTNAGTAAYSNTASFFLAASAGTAAYSNASAFLQFTQTNWPLSQITNAGTAAYSNGTAFAVNSSGGITGALGYTPGTNGTTAMTNVLFKTNYLASTHAVVAGYGFLASSNGALYWITEAKTNLLSNGF